MRAALLLAALSAACATPPPPGPDVPPGFVLQYRQDFREEEALNDFQMSDPLAWTWNPAGSLDLIAPSNYAPPFRSPLSIAILRTLRFGDFVLEAELLQTGREYGHRDLCLFLGFTDPTHYSYVHLATTPDPNAHNVFLVDLAPRRSLGAIGETGVDWGTDVWHRVRVERLGGRIRVFFDDFETPVFDVLDRTRGKGYVGFGSFDDTGRFRAVRIWASTASAKSGWPFGEGDGR